MNKYKFVIYEILILWSGNLICYQVNDRFLNPITNTACLIVMCATIYKIINGK